MQEFQIKVLELSRNEPFFNLKRKILKINRSNLSIDTKLLNKIKY